MERRHQVDEIPMNFDNLRQCMKRWFASLKSRPLGGTLPLTVVLERPSVLKRNSRNIPGMFVGAGEWTRLSSPCPCIPPRNNPFCIWRNTIWCVLYRRCVNWGDHGLRRGYPVSGEGGTRAPCGQDLEQTEITGINCNQPSRSR